MTCSLDSSGGFDGSGSEQTKITPLLPKDSVPVSWGAFGQDEDGLDDSLLELSEGEEDDGHFSYTEEEIRELLKDDDSLNEQCLGGLSAGGETETLGSYSCPSLDSPQDINVRCSLGPRAGPATIFKLPQKNAPANNAPTLTKSPSRHFVPEKNLLKITVVPPFNTTVCDDVLGPKKTEFSSKDGTSNADCLGTPPFLEEDMSKEDHGHNDGKLCTKETSSTCSVWEGPQPQKAGPLKGAPRAGVRSCEESVPSASPAWEQPCGTEVPMSSGNGGRKLGDTTRPPAVQSTKPVRLDKGSEKKERYERRLGKVVPLLQAKARSKIQTFSKTELEQKKQIYLKNVIAHLKNPQESNQGTLGELYALMDQVANVEYQMHDQRWQHPSDLTMRNYPRFRQKPLQKYSLTQWVDRNFRSHRRFQGLADQFQHTPVVSSPHL
ncbi:S100P-binding protein [Dromiciops gliroides]|uniref:S100P-binding protein n=1 Tax=Dromiciops gliroides TaxID=33562 RepID=UPI001CC7D6BD|nr:S100P-binding protein [Dromiciops gliroides]XP_043851503.1 S100P-binding protein [Dromiciops gliroides]XP_043851504.1 S100P-binding protein [Dromiciops gliroides]XP_043851505.1 S100P-binding protein [Dromiciops gliroides]XP_043851506.1 S100P-binding protein [Dromiciops gliroides]XP_043851507.1 S100P-binding protein [Dromiciops gliroides]XP_043851508.1 S100P-binding protein [Dromiciops gliroides]